MDSPQQTQLWNTSKPIQVNKVGISDCIFIPIKLKLILKVYKANKYKKYQLKNCNKSVKMLIYT